MAVTDADRYSFGRVAPRLVAVLELVDGQAILVAGLAAVRLVASRCQGYLLHVDLGMTRVIAYPPDADRVVSLKDEEAAVNLDAMQVVHERGLLFFGQALRGSEVDEPATKPQG